MTQQSCPQGRLARQLLVAGKNVWGKNTISEKFLILPWFLVIPKKNYRPLQLQTTLAKPSSEQCSSSSCS